MDANLVDCKDSYLVRLKFLIPLNVRDHDQTSTENRIEGAGGFFDRGTFQVYSDVSRTTREVHVSQFWASTLGR